MDLDLTDEHGPFNDGTGCEGCGNDDGPWLWEGRRLCLDCLELEDEREDGSTTPVRVHDHEVGLDHEALAIDPHQVDPIHLPRLGGLT